MQTTRIRFRFVAILAAFLMVTAWIVQISGGFVSAHEMSGEDHPAHIHTGSCDAVGDVIYPLSNVGSQGLTDGTPMATGDTVAASDAIPVETSVTTVPSSLADLVAGGYLINIHESAEQIQNYIACGAIGGVMLGTSDLAIGIGERNGSEYSGSAWLHDNGDGTTNVTVVLSYKDSDDDSGHDQGDDHGDDDAATSAAATATDTASASAGAAEAVDISGFAFNPGSITIKVGDTVTWTNNDSAAHTVTQDGGGFQSGKLDPGMSFSFTFDTAGTFEYHCEFHPSMSGTIVVQ